MPTNTSNIASANEIIYSPSVGFDTSDVQVSAPQTCLHCRRIVEDQYCSHCGQKITTSRFHLHHIFSADLVNGMYNLNPGILYTLRCLVTRPGHAVRDYVNGKRADFLNYLSFFILAMTVLHFIHEYSHVQVENLFVTRVNRSVLSFNDNIIHNNSKLFAFLTTPLVSLISYWTFKQAGQNFAEHFVLNVFKTGASMLLVSLFYLLAVVYSNHVFLKISYVGFFLLQVVYEIIFYYQYFSPFGYTRNRLILRSTLVALFSFALLIDKWIIVM